MEDSSQQRTSSPQYSADPRIAHQKVIQPDASFVAEVKAPQQPVASPKSIYPGVTTGLSTPDHAATSANETTVIGVTESPQSIQAAQPGRTNSGPRPATNGQIPVGMSASQMGFSQSQRDMSWRTFLKPVLTTVIVLMVLGAGYLTLRYLTGYGTRTVQGDGFTYTVIYNRAASEVTINGRSYLQGRDQSGHAILMYVAKSVQTNFDCHAVAGGDMSVIATPEIEGKQHNLCYAQTLDSYEVNFTHNGVWYYLVIKPKDQSQTLNQDTVKMIADSVSISQ